MLTVTVFYEIANNNQQLPIDRSSECASARLSTNTTRTSKTNCSTNEFSSLERKTKITAVQIILKFKGPSYMVTV